MSKNNFYFKIVTLIFLFLIINISLKSQTSRQQSGIANEREKLDSIILSERLDSLPGSPRIYFSQGYSIRSKAIQQLVRNCITFYTPLFPRKEFNAKILLLNKSDWEKLPFPHPYGLPHYTDINESLIVPADKNALSHLNNQSNKNESDTLVSGYDYVALHELGHYFFFTLYKIDREHWFNEVMASYFLICYLQSKQLPLDLGEINTSFVPEHKTLADFEKYYVRVGPQNYDWYQRKFIQLDYSLYPSFKTDLIKKILENYSLNEERPETLNLFINLAPEIMNSWLKTMQ